MRKRPGFAPSGGYYFKLHEQQEILDPIPTLYQPVPQNRYSIPRTRIPKDKWSEVTRRNAEGFRLRQLAEVYGVSYEAVRQLVKRSIQEQKDPGESIPTADEGLQAVL